MKFRSVKNQLIKIDSYVAIWRWIFLGNDPLLVNNEIGGNQLFNWSENLIWMNKTSEQLRWFWFMFFIVCWMARGKRAALLPAFIVSSITHEFKLFYATVYRFIRAVVFTAKNDQYHPQTLQVIRSKSEFVFILTNTVIILIVTRTQIFFTIVNATASLKMKKKTLLFFIESVLATYFLNNRDQMSMFAQFEATVIPDELVNIARSEGLIIHHFRCTHTWLQRLQKITDLTRIVKITKD